MKKAMLTLLAGLCTATGFAQRNCGHEAYIHYLDSLTPGFKASFAAGKAKALEAAQAYRYAKDISGPLSKTSADTVTIPVVFHVILDPVQLAKIDGVSGVEERIVSQLRVLNEDYNARNADAINIPAVWKSRYADMGIHFGLAHTDPRGLATPGYEIRTASVPSSFSSGNACKLAKTDTTGGMNPWDNKRYLNIWIIDIAGAVLGVTAPPPGTSTGFTDPEKGIALDFLAFGARTRPAQEFVDKNTDGGRTLTHEMGHYFYLWHTWGDDGGLCPGSGGEDDGIADTPPEEDATYGSPTYPKYDACSNSSTNGIMFMNYMDYTYDVSMYMFTNGQSDVANGQLQPGENSYSLTLHPELINYPTVSVTDPAMSGAVVTVSPNPAADQVHIAYSGTTGLLLNIAVVNILGQRVLDVSPPAAGMLDVSGLPRGTYVLECKFEKGIVNKKIVLE